MKSSLSIVAKLPMLAIPRLRHIFISFALITTWRAKPSHFIYCLLPAVGMNATKLHESKHCALLTGVIS
jgi:hypothetical protein